MKLRMITAAVLVALVSMVIAPAQLSAKPKPANPVSIPVSGGNFQGQFRLESVQLTNNNTGLAVVGDLLGMNGEEIESNIVWAVDLAETQARNAAAAPTGFNALVTCDILELVLGPLDLNLLGLHVELSQVILTITGDTGALLGNLLCGLLGGLDLDGLLAILGELNGLLANLQGVIDSLTGLLDILDGQMLLNNFTNAGGQVIANGMLTDLDGTLADIPVSGPVDLAATQASCDILHLVLGPLHLDLLGLIVDLNQVTLDITAEPGAGNLLGNLLCAVANLLNGPSPLGGLTALLNNILRVLGGA